MQSILIALLAVGKASAAGIGWAQGAAALGVAPLEGLSFGRFTARLIP